MKSLNKLSLPQNPGQQVHSLQKNGAVRWIERPTANEHSYQLFSQDMLLCDLGAYRD